MGEVTPIRPGVAGDESADLRGSSVARLVEAGVKLDTATLYVDAALEYAAASANIRQHGAIVQHPRTGNPIENPYLAIRDRAFRNLRTFRGISADWLWTAPAAGGDK